VGTSARLNDFDRRLKLAANVLYDLKLEIQNPQPVTYFSTTQHQ
jgi:hypothetical protein